MAESGGDANVPLESYRAYLRLLAGTQLDPRLQGKFEPSDAVQETLLRAHQALHNFQPRGDGDMAAWLRQILGNVLIDAVRRYTAAARDVALERSLPAAIEQSSARLEEWLRAEQGSPEQELLRQEQMLLLAESLARLPDDQRSALELKHLHGWTVEAIANHMGRTRAAIAGLLRRGLETLRDLLAEGEEDHGSRADPPG
jgi:RNA polymerase sigma-70 factor (ECF subfamily)